MSLELGITTELSYWTSVHGQNFGKASVLHTKNSLITCDWVKC